MGWDDVVFGVLTGGAYNVGKTVYQAGDAAEQAGDALEEISAGAGNALAIFSSTFARLGKDMSSFLKELEELLTVKRVAPRDEDDLWDEEVERLDALRAMEADLLAQLQAIGGTDDDRSWFESFFGSIFGQFSQDELGIRMKLAIVRASINEILYEEPGVVPTTIHSVQLILERFNSLEQPRIEEILDSVNDNLEESKEVLQEVKKLFVIKTWKAIPVAELPEIKVKELEVLEAAYVRFDSLIKKNSAVSQELQQALLHAQPEKLQIPKIVGTAFKRVPDGGSLGPDVVPEGTEHFAVPIEGPGENQPRLRAVHATGPSFALNGKVSAVSGQPLSISVATALNKNAVTAYQDNYQTVDGRVRYYMREKLKVEKAIFNVKWIVVEEPGVIPKILDEVLHAAAHFRIETQPRVDTILDGVRATVSESTSLIANVNKSWGSLQGTLDFLAKYSLFIKIGLAVGGVLILLILLMALIVLVRAAFGF